MQVKKYEARSMQDALVMIKKELGPEAIILSAKNLSKGFGLLNQGSVEVTAAVSETVLAKKKLLESKLRDQDKERLAQIPARAQKEMMTKVMNRYVEKNRDRNRSVTQVPYISIQDDEEVETPQQNTKMKINLDELAKKADVPMPQQKVAINNKPVVENSKMRVQSATQEALLAGKDLFDEPVPSQVREPVASPAAQVPAHKVENAEEVAVLKQEIERLQSVISNFKQVPQNFVSAHPGAQYGIPYELNFIYEKLSGVGISAESIVEIVQAAKASLPREQLVKAPLVDAFAAKYILDNVKIADRPYEKRIHSFVGPSGVGKTSSLVKMASHLVLKHKKKVAVLTNDTFKIGAVDQLKIYCRILNVPCYVVSNANEFQQYISQLREFDHVLVDFPGFSLQSIEEIDHIRSILSKDLKADMKTHLVLSCASKDQDCIEIAQRYKVAQFDDVIFTSLDQSSQHGVIYNFNRKTSYPLHSFGLGSRIPEDYEVATKERVLDLLFKLTKLNKQRG